MPLKPWKVLNSTLLHQTPWINLQADECEVDGKVITYTYAHRRDEGPQIIAEEADGRLWLVQQYRHPIKKIVWQFPAEGKKPEESWEETAQRGLMEEIGKKADHFVELAVTHPDPGFLDQTTHVFLATGLTEAPAIEHYEVAGEVEELHSKAFTLEEIDQLIERGEVCDGWTLGGLYLYKRYRKL